MPGFPDPDSQLLNGAIAIALITVSFLAYYVITVSGFVNHMVNHRFSPEEASIRLVLLHRLAGVLCFGLLPWLVILFIFQKPASAYGLDTDSLPRSLLWWIPAGLLVVVVNSFAAGNQNNLEQYPQIRVSHWSYGLLLLSALSWMVYLVAYEFMFRGILLFSCLESFGFWPAMIINVSLYSLTHLPKGPRETLASLFFGLILCFVTIVLGAFWFALLTHITLALSNEWFSISRHPEMSIVKREEQG